MIRYGVDDRASIPGRRIDFSMRHPFYTESSAQLVTDLMGKEGPFLRDNAVGVWNLPVTVICTEVKSAWNCTSNSPYICMAWCFIEHINNCISAFTQVRETVLL